MEEQNCGVCLDVLKQETTAKLDGCIHQYHFSCIKEWADISNVCPLCKARFSLLTRLKDNSSVRIRGKDADFTHDQFYYSGEDEEADDFDDEDGVDNPGNESDLSDFVVGDDVVEYESSYDGSEDESDFVAASRRLNALAFDDEENYFDDGDEDDDEDEEEEEAEDAPFVCQKKSSPWEILDVDEDEDDVCWRTLKAKPSRTSSLVRSFSESSSSSSSSTSKTKTLKLRATSSSQPTRSSGEEKKKKKQKVEDLTVDSTEPPKKKLVKRSRSQINLVSSSPPPTSSLPTSRSLPVAVIDLASTPEPKVVPPRKRRRVIDESCSSQVSINLENFPPSPSPLNQTTTTPTASQESKPRRLGPPKGPLTQWFSRPPV